MSQPAGRGTSTPSSIDARNPVHRLSASQDGWAYSLGAVVGEEFPRGVYRRLSGTWRQVAPLPYVLEKLIRRDASGDPRSLSYRLSMAPDGSSPAVKISTDELRTGDWAARLGAALAGDPKIIQSTYTAITDVALASPEREITPRVHAGELELPPEDVTPAGYGRCAGTEEQARAAWRELLGIAARTPRLALALGATVGGLYIGPLHRQSFWVWLCGNAGEGKTTATRASAALLGSCATGQVIKTWNSTVNAVCSELGNYSMLTAIRDEWGTAPPTLRRELETLLFQTTEGATKSRGKKDGDTWDSAEWHGVLLTSANMSLLGQVSTPGGPARRVLEIPAPITNTADDAERVEQLAYTAYGWPLHWLRQAGFAVDGMAAMIKQAERDIGLPRDGVARGIAKHFAVATAGAERLEHLTGVPGLRTAVLTESRDLLADQMREIIEHGATAADRLLNAVVEHFTARPAAFPPRQLYEAAIRGDTANPPYIAREVDGWLLTNDTYPGDLAVRTIALERICEQAGLDNPRMALRDLERNGHLVRCHYTTKGKPDSRRTHKLRVHGDWRPWCYVFKLDGLAPVGEIPPDDRQPDDTPPTQITPLVEPAAETRNQGASGTGEDQPSDRADFAVPEVNPAGTDPAAVDDSIVIGTAGPVWLSEYQPCRVCELPAPSRDRLGPVHALCALHGDTAVRWHGGTATKVDEHQAAASESPAPRVIEPDPAGLELIRPDPPAAADAGPAIARDRLQLAGVVDDRGLWLPGGSEPIPVDLVAGIDSAYDLAARHYLRGLWLHPTAHAVLGLPAIRSGKNPAEPFPHDWATTDRLELDPPGLAAWVNVQPANGDGRRLALAFPAYESRVPWRDAADGPTLLAGVLTFARTTGEAYYYSPNQTSADMIVRHRFDRKGRNQLQPVQHMPPVAGRIKELGAWSRSLLDEEAGALFVHEWDKNGAELGVQTDLWLGIGDPEHHTGPYTWTRADRTRAAYHLTQVPRQHPNLGMRLPGILRAWEEVDGGGPAWVRTDMLVLLDELNVPFEITESYVWRESARILRPYYEALMEARRTLTARRAEPSAALALAVLKPLYASRNGDYKRATGKIRRPDFWDAIKIRLAANMYRTARTVATQSGRYPIALYRDALFYVSNEHDPDKAVPPGLSVGDQLTDFSHEGCVPLVDVAAALGSRRFHSAFDKALRKRDGKERDR
jgi:uncharacterized protein DUF927